MPTPNTTLGELGDKFYPHSETIANWGFGARISMLTKIADHLTLAKAGNTERESRLINRMGQLRRHHEWAALDGNLKEVVKEAIQFLRSVGRTVDFKNENPALWISARGGGPRWVQTQADPKIVSVEIGPMPKSMFSLEMPKVVAEFDDGSQKELFTFYPDEISFSEAEFIGKTEEQAHQLRHDKDVAYLRS